MVNGQILPELLSPAGSYEAACAAFEYGADAVYLGLQEFSARDDATNFSLDELADLVGYARTFRPARKIYVTVNTLIRETEIPRLTERLRQLAALPVDALIVQDLGVLHTARTHFPDLPIHASTQMAIHNRQGVEAARDLGIRRVIPARELTRREIADLCRIPDMEIEIFVHGALCYSYSGLCLFSALEHGPSGNRGGCLYNCRNWFEPGGASPSSCAGMPFSMKDLCLDSTLDALLPLGVASLKIEGRKKSPLYVAAVTNYYRSILDGSTSTEQLRRCRQDVESIFHRPSTPLFIDTLRNPQVTDTRRSGHRGAAVGTIARVGKGNLQVAVSAGDIQRHDGLQIEIPGTSRPFGFGVSKLFRLSAAGKKSTYEVHAGETAEITLPADAPTGILPGLTVYRSSSQSVKQRYKWHVPKPGAHRPRKAVDFTLDLLPERLIAAARCENLTATASAPGPFAAARNPDGTEKAVREAFAKLGDTPFKPAACHLRNPQNLFVPLSTLNELRRRTVEQLEIQLAEEQPCPQPTPVPPPTSQPTPAPPPAPQWILKTDQPGILQHFSPASLARADEIIVDIGQCTLDDLLRDIRTLEKRTTSRLRLALPTVIRAHRTHEIKEKIQTLQARGYAAWQIGNLGHIKLLDMAGTMINSDWPLYCWNSAAAALLAANKIQGITLSPELCGEAIAALLPACPLPATIPVHQDVPLFHSAVCAKASLDQSCPGPDACTFEKMTLTNSKGRNYIAINNQCETILISDKPFTREAEIKRLTASGAAALRVDFMWRHYTPADAESIWLNICVHQSSVLNGEAGNPSLL